MNEKVISQGVVHKVARDIQEELIASPTVLKVWENITPLARNEWLCWIESARKVETKNQRIQRMLIDLKKGKRRPCCWIGCIHRTDKALSPSVQRILSKRKLKNKY